MGSFDSSRESVVGHLSNRRPNSLVRREQVAQLGLRYRPLTFNLASGWVEVSILDVPEAFARNVDT